MSDGRTLGRERRALWRRILPISVEPGSDDESDFIRRTFDGMARGTFLANMTRGFSPKHGPALRLLCDRVGEPYDPKAWLVKDFGGRASRLDAAIDWEFTPIEGVDEFYKQLLRVYSESHSYESLRVGGAFSSNRTKFVIENGLAVRPAAPSIRLPYLKVFWDRVRRGELIGQSVHLVRNLDRLLELWATVEILKDEPCRPMNKVILVSSLSEGADEYEPTMGARVVDERLVLFSMPAISSTGSQYSSWLRSERLAAFAQSYIRRAADTGKVLSGMDDLIEEKTFNEAFERLAVNAGARTTNYGLIKGIEDAVKIRNRMLDWAKEGTWLPVIS